MAPHLFNRKILIFGKTCCLSQGGSPSLTRKHVGDGEKSQVVIGKFSRSSSACGAGAPSTTTGGQKGDKALGYWNFMLRASQSDGTSQMMPEERLGS